MEEEEKRLKSEPKPDPDDSEYSEEDEDNLSVHDNDSFPFWYKRRDGTLYTNKAWKDREAKILDYKNRSSKLSVGIYQFQFHVVCLFHLSLNFD